MASGPQDWGSVLRLGFLWVPKREGIDFRECLLGYLGFRLKAVTKAPPTTPNPTILHQRPIRGWGVFHITWYEGSRT